MFERKNVMTNKGMAKDTLAILEKRAYKNREGNIVNISKNLDNCIKNTVYYSSEKLEELIEKQVIDSKFETVFEVVKSTTLSAILKIVETEDSNKVMCLNFASAKNPGGGFMSGAEAQEESLARTSALYSSQLQARVFYDTHRNMKSCIYTDAMIYSPQTPVFRKDRGELLNQPVDCNFITSAAVNAGVIKRQEPELEKEIEAVMRRRIDKMLALSLSKGNEVLVLGAWGCGVFRNDSQMIASLFKEHLRGKYKGAFKKIIFAIYTKNEDLLKTFEM
ncbi:conserved hypothetical protein [Flavobacterium sp. 9AF]|uniref:TIGR02452 family protein n=1 Tax=Flavobacterium sp. 9AF TaxID=2653142 RepID=UPI0012F057F8|nr:TIGR02452 family protein [Flavobacterium sp. 9AF]VXB80637.1 conserved hypothetical protein [Flavobacterium sp. 9AF]